MSPSAILIERLLISALLGLRFWDAATDRPISDGLRVTAVPFGRPEPWVQGAANRSGVFAFHHLPGLPTTPFEKPTGTRAYTIEVRDEFERFLPFRFTAHATGQLMTRLESVAGSPLDPSPGIPLFNATTRLVPAGMAVIRAELRDALSPNPEETPAPFARLTVAILGADGATDMTAVGVADEQGRVTIVAPYPAPAEVPLGSPLGSALATTAIPLTAQTWPVDMTVNYTALEDPTAPMDLDLTLAADRPDTEVAMAAAGPFSSSLPFTLAHGLGLSEEVADPAAHWVPITPVLFVRSSGSPL
jgi:hypothetical protein